MFLIRKTMFSKLMMVRHDPLENCLTMKMRKGEMFEHKRVFCLDFFHFIICVQFESIIESFDRIRDQEIQEDHESSFEDFHM